MPSAIDFVEGDILSYIKLNYIKNNFAGSASPSNPTAGVRWFDTGNNTLKVYRGAAFVSIGGSTDVFPPGTILAWIGGYFGDGSNGSFTNVLGNSIANANTYLNPLGWWVCDGTVPNEGDSDIWSAAGRYLPNLTDDRFIMGDTVVAVIGGSSTRAHTHTVDHDNVTSSGENNWDRALFDAGGPGIADHDHTHEFNLPEYTTGAASVTENRPLYLACFYIARVL